MSFPRYPSYKDSGVEWLGQVPEHWEVISIKWLSPVKRGASPRPIDDPKYFDDDGEFAWVRIADVSACDGVLNETTQRLSELGSSLSVKIAPGELFVSIAGTVGKPCIAAIKACIHDGFVYFPSLKIDPLFLYRIFEGGACYGGLGKWGTQLNLNTDTIGSIRVALPPADELKGLLAFLDRETGKIDELVAEQRRLMELLKEKRQAVISHAVTRGLNPAAPFKPSGIEWLGDVPAHWEVSLLKRAFRSVDYGISDSLDSEGAIGILRMGNIANGKVVMDDLKYTGSIDPALLLVRGDLLYNRTNSLDLIGKVGMFLGGDGPVSFASYLVRLRTVDDSLPKYFAYFLNTDGILGLARANAFVAIGQCNLNPTRYGQIGVAIPPKAEQAAIVTFLDTELAKLDTLTAEAQRAIDLLQERRTALISAAVTGQIDVRPLIEKKAA
jgi:type I restriction enzyme S subunit